MIEKNALGVMEFLDSDLIVEASTYESKKNTTRKNSWVSAVACLCLVLAGAWSITNYFVKQNPSPIDVDPTITMDPSAVNVDPPVTQDLPETSGLTIPAIILTDTPSESIDMKPLVIYNGGVYTEAHSYWGFEAQMIEPLLGKYLGHATGSIDEWSGQEEYKVEFASNVEGDLYEVIGYDTDFRICVCHMFENEAGNPELWILFLEKLNGITLSTGADLFETKLGLSSRVESVRWKSHDEWNQNVGSWQTSNLDISCWADFLSEVNCGSFVSTWNYDNTYDKGIYSTSKQVHLLLTMKDETVVSLRLIDGGYVGYDALPNYFIQIPGDAFNIIFDACGGNG